MTRNNLKKTSGGYLIYRCRQCNTPIFTEDWVDDVHAFLTSLMLSPAPPVIPHDCLSSNFMGVAELSGVHLVKNKDIKKDY